MLRHKTPCRLRPAVVGRVGILLRFETHSAATAVADATLTDHTIKEIACIDLQTRHISIDLKADIRRRTAQNCRRTRQITRRVQHPAMVVSAAYAQLLKISIDITPDGFGRAEIQGRASHRIIAPKRNKRFVDRQIPIGIYHKGMVKNRTVLIAIEVPIAVVGQVQHRGTIGNSIIVNTQTVVVAQRVGHTEFDATWETVVAIGAGQRQLQTSSIVLNNIENSILPSVGTAVQTVRPVVLRQPIFNTVDRNASPSQAVGIAANHGTKVRQMIFRKIILHTVKSLYNVDRLSATRRDRHAKYAGTKITDCHRYAITI